MKKTRMLLLAALMALALAACGAETADPAKPSAQASAPAAESIQPGQDQDDEQSLGDAMEESLAGGFHGKIEAGDTVLEAGGKWPDYELLLGVPQPAVGTVSVTEEVAGKMASVMLTGMSLDDCKAYAKQLSGAGFDTNVSEAEMGGVYSFSADNGDGLHIDCGYVSEAVMIQVSVPEDR